MMTLQEAYESGWEGDQAKEFVTWSNQVDQLFARRYGAEPCDLLGDYPQADYFEDGLTPREVVNILAEGLGF